MTRPANLVGSAPRGLSSFGAPLTDLSTDDLVDIGVAPIRIDILAGIDGVTFEDAWPRRVEANLGTLTVPVLGLADLATKKRAGGRPKDLADLAWIEEQLRHRE